MNLNEFIEFYERDPDLAYDWTASEDTGRLLLEAVGQVRILRDWVKELQQ